MVFRVQSGTVRESFVLVLEEMDGDGYHLVLPVTLVRSQPGGNIDTVELRWHDQKLAISPERFLAAAEFVKSKLP